MLEKLGIDRSSLQDLSDARFRDAEVLLTAGRWDAAYYLFGYSVECALKACVAKRFREFEVPDKRLVNDFYTHRLEDLLRICGLREVWDERMKADLKVAQSWSVIMDWGHDARYALGRTEQEVLNLRNAISEILPWLKTQW